jgi:hypothetical protein
MITSQFKANDFGNTLQGADDRVKLPFGTLNLSWHNGFAQTDAANGAKRYGGWYSSDDKLNFVDDLASINQSVAPTGFVGPEKWTNDKSQQYTAYSCRRIFAAPVATRVRWETKEGKSSSTTSVLVYLGNWDSEKKVIQAYAPAVLTAKGWAGNFIVDAFKKWQNETADIRADIAPGIPANMFYVPIGTFGKERVTKEVGSGKKSPIVVCQIGTPGDGWTAAEMERYFVGDDVGAVMKSLKDQAAEWLADGVSDNKSAEKQYPAKGNAETAFPSDDDFPG